MRPCPRTPLYLAAFLLLAGLVVPGAAPAADITIHGVYKLPGRVKLERATYYSATRMRATMFDGNEAIYDSESGEVIFLNHTKKRFWKGPLAQANAIVDSLTMERDRPFYEAPPEKQKEWIEFTEKFNESIKFVGPLEERRKFAGRKCVGWQISGRCLINTRWFDETLTVPDFTGEIYKILLLPALDPVGRAIGQILLKARETTPGAILASYTEIDTPTQKAKFSFEAKQVDTGAIPDSVWAIPQGYEQITY